MICFSTLCSSRLNGKDPELKYLQSQLAEEEGKKIKNLGEGRGVLCVLITESDAFLKVFVLMNLD